MYKTFKIIADKTYFMTRVNETTTCVGLLIVIKNEFYSAGTQKASC